MGYAYNPLVEMWTLYAVGSLIMFLRVAVRIRLVGIAGFKPDDWMIFFSWSVYTVMSVAADICGRHADLHTLTIDVRKDLTTEEAAPYVYVTQWFCAGVATYIVFVWSLKFNMLFFYERVVNGLWVDKFIKPVMGLVAATFLAIIIILFASCRPYYRMWEIYPDQGANCEPQAAIYMLPALILNILTDLCIMAIPAPVIFPVKTTIWRKLSLVVIFSAGFFIMIASILRVDMVLVQANGSTAAIWSCREDFVAILVGQAPILRPALTTKFWTGEMSQKSSRRTKSSMPIQSGNDAFEMGTSKKGAHNSSFNSTSKHGYDVTILTNHGRNSDGDSTDRIIEGNGIQVNTWVDIESESVNTQHQGIHAKESHDNMRY